MQNNKFTIYKSCCIQGEWWHPSTPTERIRGTLLYSPKTGIELNAQGILITHRRAFEWKGEENEVICGRSDDGVEITLGLVLLRTQKGNLYSEFTAKYILFGNCFSSWNDINLQSVSIEYPNLEKWMCRSPFECNSGIFSFNLPRTGSFAYRIPEPIRFELLEVESTSFQITPFMVQHGPFHGRLSLKLQDIINISTKAPQPIQFFLDRIARVSLLLCFVFKQRIIPLRIQGLTKDEWKEINIIRPPHASKRMRTKSKIRPLFTFTDVSNDFPSFIRTWFAIADKYKTVLQLLLSGATKKQFLEARLLQLMQAIEILGQLNVSRSQAKQLLLRKNVQEQVESLVPNAKRLILQTKNPSLFVEDLITYRNHFTHYSKVLRKPDWLRDVLLLLPKLELMIAHGLLRACNFNDTLINHLLRTGYQAQST